jgi:DNA repair exonuclease SbcCD ATPase subunit
MEKMEPDDTHSSFKSPLSPIHTYGDLQDDNNEEEENEHDMSTKKALREYDSLLNDFDERATQEVAHLTSNIILPVIACGKNVLYEYLLEIAKVKRNLDLEKKEWDAQRKRSRDSTTGPPSTPADDRRDEEHIKKIRLLESQNQKLARKVQELEAEKEGSDILLSKMMDNFKDINDEKKKYLSLFEERTKDVFSDMENMRGHFEKSAANVENLDARWKKLYDNLAEECAKLKQAPRVDPQLYKALEDKIASLEDKQAKAKSILKKKEDKIKELQKELEEKQKEIDDKEKQAAF